MPELPAEPARADRLGGLIVPVPEVEAALADLPVPCLLAWQIGIPAHVTLLFPFPTLDELDAVERAELAELFARVPPLRVTFESVGQFPDVLYLRPEPRAWFAYLTQALAQQFKLPPYGGLHREIVPHLTVTRHADPAILAAVEEAITPRLPIVANVSEVCLLEEEADGRRRCAATFPLVTTTAAEDEDWARSHA